MPIKPIVLQRRHAELGRIRLGYKAETQNGRTRPAKLERFRFTSPSERYIGDLAELYGGTPRPWDNSGKPEHEVYTEATSVPVIAVKGGLSQWMETWSGGGCVHRCDGETNVLTGLGCDPNDPAHQNAKPTTRLSVMLVELEALGVWRLETHGWNAAAEIPAVAELAQYVGDLVPAHLHLVERRAIKDGKTSRFVVPVLDLQIGTARLKEIVAQRSGTVQELEGPGDDGRLALEGGASAAGTGKPPADAPATDPYQSAFAAVVAADTLDRLKEIWDIALREGLVGSTVTPTERMHEFIAAFKARAHDIKSAKQGEAQPTGQTVSDATAAQPAAAAPAEEPGPVTASTEPDEDAVWQQILKAGGERGMSLADIEEDFTRQMGGLSSAEASAAELSHYLGLLTGERAA